MLIKHIVTIFALVGKYTYTLSSISCLYSDGNHFLFLLSEVTGFINNPIWYFKVLFFLPKTKGLIYSLGTREYQWANELTGKILLINSVAFFRGFLPYGQYFHDLRGCMPSIPMAATGHTDQARAAIKAPSSDNRFAVHCVAEGNPAASNPIAILRVMGLRLTIQAIVTH